MLEAILEAAGAGNQWKQFKIGATLKEAKGLDGRLSGVKIVLVIEPDYEN